MIETRKPCNIQVHHRRILFRLIMLGLGPMLIGGIARPASCQIVSAIAGPSAKPFSQRKLIEISPAKPPIPALKYRLFPSPADMKSGDAATFYHRAMRQLGYRDRKIDIRENEVRRQDGKTIPFREQTIGELAELLGKALTNEDVAKLKATLPDSNSPVFADLLNAESLTECDWGFDAIKDRPLWEYIGFLLPEIQDVRFVARYLALKARVEISEGRLDEAIRTIRVGLKMSKDAERARFLVCSLVGLATAKMMLEEVEQLIAQPESPNLYWALASMPQPLVSVKPAWVHELEFLRNGAGLRFLQNPEQQNFSAPEFRQRLLQDVATLTRTLGLARDVISPQDGLLLLRAYPVAKRELIQEGFSSQRIEEMPVAQVISIHQSRRMKAIADEFLKLQNLDYVAIQKAFAKVEQSAVGKFGAGSAQVNPEFRELLPIAQLLVPAVSAVVGREAALQRKVAALQTLEAIRLYAAETGHLPETLDAIQSVPVPRNPETGKPFRYLKTEAGFELWELNPDDFGFERARIYEIRLKQE